jgi:hypothetical protein
VLVELLRPPPGAELVRGIATTFTLDLTSALTAPLSFASHRLGSGKDPEAIMQAITMASDHLDIFCQAGQLNVPRSPSDLMAFLEKMVHTVRSPHTGGLFHPKIWLLEFSAGAETSFRLLCASRNRDGHPALARHVGHLCLPAQGAAEQPPAPAGDLLRLAGPQCGGLARRRDAVGAAADPA